MACRIEPHCSACNVCIAICPVGAIRELASGVTIHPLLCTECLGFADAPVCIPVCPCDAISWGLPQPSVYQLEQASSLLTRSPQ